MKKASYKKVNLTSSNLSEEKLAGLRRILPEAFSEEKIDWDKLRAVLGDDVDVGVEKFGFTWAGKSNAIKNVLIPSKATLTPAPDESVKFDESENLFIEGDNLEVLKLLQKAYFEKVKMIYIDPPYNTGGDFVYKDNFASPVKNYLEQTGQIDSEGNKLSTNKETNGRYHSDWLSMMYPRLKLAWNLLRDDGVIFVSIDDNEVHNLRQIMNEVFGEENFVETLVWLNKEGGGGSDSSFFKKKEEYILVYAKTKEQLTINGIQTEEDNSYSFEDEYVNERGRYKLIKLNSFSIQYSASLDYEITLPNGEKIVPSENGKKGCWRWSKQKVEWGIKNNFIEFKENADGKLWVYTKQYFKVDHNGEPITRTLPPSSLIESYSSTRATKDLEELMGKKLFDYPKPHQLVQFLVKTSCNEGLVLDFFAGSGTTAHAVLKQNKEDGQDRKFILVQLPEPIDEKSEAYKDGYKTIADIGIERVKRAIAKEGIDSGFKVFKLAESNYPENTFEFDPEQSESENQKAFEEYLDRAKQNKLIDDVDETSIIYENIVKEGFSLNSNIAEGVKGDNKIYTITDGDKQFSICLDRDIKDSTVKNLMEWAKGTTFICFDNALGDSAKANLGLNLELKTI